MTCCGCFSGWNDGERGLTIGGHALNLRNITCDTYVLGGETDHITPWDGCYLTTRGLGGQWSLQLSQSGHIQSLINPPGNAKARFLTNPAARHRRGVRAGAETHSGSWWPHWLTWLNARGGAKVKVPRRRSARSSAAGHGRAPGAYALAAA